jgi:uncharacterized protein (UPF0147 family)
MSEETVNSIIEALSQIKEDLSVPKNVRIRMDNAIQALQDKNINIKVKVDKSLQELESLDEDPNIPVYTRTQIWDVVSLLESL